MKRDMAGSPTTSRHPGIVTVSGKRFDFLTPAGNVIRIADIAHALSRICRFAGHTVDFYSVAQHSVLVSQIVAPEYALAGLLHDAVEAYIGDVTRPLKDLLPDYRAIEQRLQADIFQKLGLPEEIPAEVKCADQILAITEIRDLMPEPLDAIDDVALAHLDPLPDIIVPWAPVIAARCFLERYRELVDARTDVERDAGRSASLESSSAGDSARRSANTIKENADVTAPTRT